MATICEKESSVKKYIVEVARGVSRGVAEGEEGGVKVNFNGKTAFAKSNTFMFVSCEDAAKVEEKDVEEEEEGGGEEEEEEQR